MNPPDASKLRNPRFVKGAYITLSFFLRDRIFDSESFKISHGSLVYSIDSTM